MRDHIKPPVIVIKHLHPIVVGERTVEVPPVCVCVRARVGGWVGDFMHVCRERKIVHRTKETPFERKRSTPFVAYESIYISILGKHIPSKCATRLYMTSAWRPAREGAAMTGKIATIE